MQQDIDNSYGLSVIQSGYEEILRVGQRGAAVDRMMSRASLAVLQLNDILETIASDGETELESRMRVLAKGIERTSMLFLLPNESYRVESTTLTGIDEPVKQSLQMVAAAFGYPLSVLLGPLSPSGLNTTGEADLQQYHSKVISYRNVHLQPAVSKLYSWILEKQFEVEFGPVWEPSESEQAANNKARAELFDTMVSWGATEKSCFEALQKEGVIPESLELEEVDLTNAAQNLTSQALNSGNPAGVPPTIPANNPGAQPGEQPPAPGGPPSPGGG
jgi:phage-related protein (TIGR01555 family)